MGEEDGERGKGGGRTRGDKRGGEEKRGEERRGEERKCGEDRERERDDESK